MDNFIDQIIINNNSCICQLLEKEGEEEVLTNILTTLRNSVDLLFSNQDSEVIFNELINCNL